MLTDLAATEQDVKNIYKVGLNTTRLLLASGDVVVGYLLLRGAAVAAEKLARPPPPQGRRRSTRARSRRRSSSPRTSCRASPASAQLAEAVDLGPDGAGRGRVLRPE